jgi:heterodisulfide reductase subunit A
MKDALRIDIFDTTTSKLFEIKTDMVVLVPAMIPRTDTTEFSRFLHLTLSGDGFFLEAHPKLRPVDTFVNGIFIAGCCQGPKDIQDTVSQASGAASRAATILSQKELEIEPTIAVVDDDLCSGCAVCVSVCPYNAIERIEEDVNGKTVIHVKVNEGLCQGCGTCVSACPSSAIQQKGFKDTQLLPMIDEMV